MHHIKFAVLGCGHIGKRHAEMIQRNGYARLVALIDIKDKSELKLDSFNTPFFCSLEAFLESGIETDVINIATPNGLHASQALQCLNAGKHVVVEKPIALTKQDAEKMICAAELRRKHIFCVMQNRYSPPSVWIKDLVNSGTIGKIFLVQLNCFWNRDERYYTKKTWHGTKDLDGGTLFTQFSHFIDILYWLFGDVEQIEARLASFNHQHLTEFEDSGIATFNFLNGGMGCISFSTSVLDKNMESSIIIIAENGSIKIGGQYMDKVEYCHLKNYTMPKLLPTNPAHDYGAYKGSATNHSYIIENAVDVLNGRADVATNATEGLRVVDMIERIYNAAKK